jgi:hypothetical protein
MKKNVPVLYAMLLCSAIACNRTELDSPADSESTTGGVTTGRIPSQATISHGFEDAKVAPPFVIEAGNGNTADAIRSTFTPREGTHLARFIWNENNYDDTRLTRGVEARTSSTANRITKEGWYGFSFYIPSSTFLTKNNIIAQMHAYTSTYNPEKTVAFGIGLMPENSPSDRALKVHYYSGVSSAGDQTPVGTRTGDITIVNPCPVGQWIDIVMYVKYSKSNQGAFKLWYRGNLIVNRGGINIGSDAWNGDALLNGTYQKFGIYAYDKRLYTPGEERRIYFDNVSYVVGNPANGYDIVKP